MPSARARTTPASFHIESLPGAGPALAARIRTAFGTDDAFRDACTSLDLDPLFAIEGLSERRAFELVANVRRETETDLCATERTREIRRELEDQLAAFAHTSYGRRALRLLPVFHDPATIGANAERVMHARDQAERLDRAAVAKALQRLTILRDPTRLGGLHRVVIVDDQDQEFELRGRGLDRWCRIVSGRDAQREAARDGLVVYAGDEKGALDADAVIELDRTAPVWDFVPETEVEFVRLNRGTLEALSELARLTGGTSAASACLDAAEDEAGHEPPDFQAAANEALRVASAALSSSMGTLSLTGSQVLQLLSSGLPDSVAAARAEAIKLGRAAFKQLTGKDWDVFLSGLPLGLDDEEILRMKEEAAARASLESFERRQGLARRIHAERPRLEEELRRWLRFDVEFALGCWALETGSRPARSSDQLRFESAIPLRVAKSAQPQPISYRVGGAEPIAVLTGANSGGKSTLLEVIAQLILLHHWGLPVPAQEAEIPLLDEVMLFTASRGVTAGAFETFLQDLFPPLTRPGRRFLLLDEVESMTELEAAGRILGVFLGEVRRTGALCVLVTHLPTEVLQHAQVPVRIDGIDAVGLDENFNLIVDRQPKLNHRARSTPELILRRVHARSQGVVKELYGRILQRWSQT